MGGRRLFGFIAFVALVPILGFMPIFDWMSPTRIDRDRPGRGTGRAVILVSIDGLAPRVLASVPTPGLDRLAAEGRSARGRTEDASYTMPSHTSMISGVHADEHGVRWNRYQPWSRIGVTTLFGVCEVNGLRCGLFAGKRKFAHFAEDELGVDRYAFAPSADEVFEAALAYYVERSPDFMMIHLAEVDLAGHDAGWGSDEQRSAIADIDAGLARFAESAGRQGRPLTLVVTADHGGHGTRHGTLLPDDLAIPWIAWGSGVGTGDLGEVDVADTAPTVLALLGLPIPGDWSGRARIQPE